MGRMWNSTSCDCASASIRFSVPGRRPANAASVGASTVSPSAFLSLSSRLVTCEVTSVSLSRRMNALYWVPILRISVRLRGPGGTGLGASTLLPPAASVVTTAEMAGAMTTRVILAAWKGAILIICQLICSFSICGGSREPIGGLCSWEEMRVGGIQLSCS